MKLRVADEARLSRQLARLKAKLVRERVHEMNTLYDTPEGNLARRGEMLRLRVERPAPRANRAGKAEISSWLTFKGPAKGQEAKQAGRYKIREEHEARISKPEEMSRILEALGLRPWFRYEKFRTSFTLPGMSGLKLEVDETPIGVFVELEGERGRIDRAAGLLGFEGSDYISKSYGALFMEACGKSRRVSRNEPVPACGLQDMVFRRS